MKNIGEIINKSLYEGRFPCEMMSPGDITKAEKVDLEQKAAEGLSVLKANPELAYVLLMSARDRIHEVESIRFSHSYEQQVNVLINAGYQPDSINILSNAYQKTVATKPVVTYLDKCIWFIAFIDHFSLANGMAEHVEEISQMVYAWIYLLLYVQNKELESGLTIKIDSFDSSLDFLEIVYSPWGRDGIYQDLSSDEVKQLKFLQDQRLSLSSLCQSEIDSAFSIAQKTKDQWSTFIDLMNDIQYQESNAIQRVCEDGSKRDRLSAINDYNYILLGVKKGRYLLNGSEIQLLPLFSFL